MRDPDARSGLFKDHIARDLEKEITQEEDAGAPAEDVGAKPQVFIHRQRGEADVGAIDVCDEVDDDDQR